MNKRNGASVNNTAFTLLVSVLALMLALASLVKTKGYLSSFTDRYSETRKNVTTSNKCA